MSATTKEVVTEEYAQWFAALPRFLQHACDAPDSDDVYMVHLRSGLLVTCEGAYADATAPTKNWVQLLGVISVTSADGKSLYTEDALISGVDVNVSEIAFVMKPAHSGSTK